MSNNKIPSLAVLLGLVAVAGYQNREKIGEFVKGLSDGDESTPVGKLVAQAKKAVGGAEGFSLPGSLGELVDKFKQAGQGTKADSWVSSGSNEPVEAPHVEKALGDDLIDQLLKQTGLSKQELLDRLTKSLPEAVDKLTPDGKLPA
ncbi:MAG: YidB family protein [Proteobacteria bacterium]|nr:YidB family protein [Pseudomonadota bacterium]